MKKINYFTILLAAAALIGCTESETKQPNIVIIYADDMGYGDLNVQNPDSKIPTPFLDQLASEGMRFTDAHSSSGICSPSRYALLTGTYHWRRQHGIVGSFGKPFFNESDITLPDVLRENGYTTACIGKWHLGWNWEI
jgi:arylsulfatase A